MPDSMEMLVEKYSRRGHPTVDELIAAQNLLFPRDPRDLLGNFWPEEESIDDFLAALRAWRGLEKTDPAASGRPFSTPTSSRFCSKMIAAPKSTCHVWRIVRGSSRS